MRNHGSTSQRKKCLFSLTLLPVSVWNGNVMKNDPKAHIVVFRTRSLYSVPERNRVLPSHLVPQSLCVQGHFPHLLCSQFVLLPGRDQNGHVVKGG